MILGPSRLLALTRTPPPTLGDAVAGAINLAQSLDSINERMIAAMYLLEVSTSALNPAEFKACITGAHAVIQAAWVGEQTLPAETDEILALMRMRAILHDAMKKTK